MFALTGLGFFVTFTSTTNSAGSGCKSVPALWRCFLPSCGAGDFAVWMFRWLELHLTTTGQCYSVDVLGV